MLATSKMSPGPSSASGPVSSPVCGVALARAQAVHAELGLAFVQVFGRDAIGFGVGGDHRTVGALAHAQLKGVVDHRHEEGEHHCGGGQEQPATPVLLGVARVEGLVIVRRRGVSPQAAVVVAHGSHREAGVRFGRCGTASP